MGKNKQQVPRLRFPGFNDAWEQRKLGEVAERVTRKNTEMISKLPLTISAQYGLIAQTEFFDKQIASKNISGYYLIKNGEFAYNKSYSNGYPWGAVKRLNNYDYGVLSTLYIVFKPTNINSQFLVSYYDTNYWHNQVASIAVEGARNHGLLNISASEFFTTTLAIPKSIQEQTAIGDFFRQLDAAIASHQRKLERVKELKKSLLQKMFPKDGEAFPELRVPDFTDAWEQRKFKELVFLRSETVESQDYSVDIELENLESNTGRIIGNTSVRTMSNTLFKKGDILFGKLRPYLNKWRFADEEGVKSGEIWAFSCREGYSNRFIYCVIQSNGFLDEVNITSGTKMPRADWKTVSNIKITIPTIEEQTTIGNFFRQLDAAIASHQRKLEHMQTLKKGLLQQMFV